MRAAWAFVVAATLLHGAAVAEDAPKGEDVTFTTADGLTIAATYYAPAEGTPLPAPVVVALPMYKHTRSSYEPMVRPVTDRGMAFLTLDLRGHGGSAKQGDADLAKNVEARDEALFTAMHRDVEAAIAWLAKEKKTPKAKVALLGASVGCSVAIDTAVRVPDEVAAVACLTPGKEYLGVPTMEHVAKWPKGKPLLLVSSEAESAGGAGPISAALDGRGAELRIVSAGPGPDAVNLHGTQMFGRVAEVEEHLADWLALQVAFRRVALGDGVVAVVGSTGKSLYVGVETPDDSKAPIGGLAVRVGTGPVTDPWSKTATVEVGARLASPSKGAGGRRRTELTRERLGAAAGSPFAVRVSLDGKKFLPEEGEPPLVFTLR